MVVMALAPLQRRRQLLQADRAVAVLVELAEHAVGLRDIGATRAERLFEFRLGDLAVAVAVDLPEQILPRVRAARGRRRRTRRRLALRIEQRVHGFRRYRCTAATARARSRTDRSRSIRGRQVDNARAPLPGAAG